MPTIHVHTDDADMIGQIVAYCLSYGPANIAVDIDRNDDVTPRRASDQDYRALVTRKSPSTNAVDEILDYERMVRASDRDRREARRRNDVEYYDEYIAMTCLQCHAGPQEPCITAHGNDLPRFQTHAARRASWSAHDETWGAVEVTDSVARATPTKVASQAVRLSGVRCMCGHMSAGHNSQGDRPCAYRECDCPSFTTVEPASALPEWMDSPVTLDEM